MLKLYYSPGSVCSQKARIGLAEAGCDYASHIVDFAAGEQFSEAYLKLNPDAVVPVLVDDGLVVRESSLILQHVDEVHGGSALTPESVADRVTTRFWLIKALAIHAAINSVTFATLIRDIDMTRTPEEREARWSRLRDPAVAAKRRDLFENGIGSVYVASAIAELARSVAIIVGQMSDEGWIAGPAYSIADAAMTAYMDRLDRLGLHVLWRDAPRIEAWLATVRDRPSYRLAIADHVGVPPTGEDRRAAGQTWEPVVAAG